MPTSAQCGTAQQAGDVSTYESCGAPEGLLSYPGLVPSGVSPSIVAARNIPAGISGSQAQIRFRTLCEACLRARGLIYWKSQPGDCPAPSPIPGISTGQVVGLSGTAASGVIGGLGEAGVLAGPATLGISTAVSIAVSAISSIFTHHAQAVANEQATICAVAAYFNPLVKQIDAAVASGQITASQGVTYMTQIVNTAIQGLQSIMQTCNAACWYSGVLKAFIDYSNSFYSALSPADSIGPQAPGGAPAYYGGTPGGVTVNSGTSQNAAPPPPLRSTAGSTYAPAGPNSNGVLAPVITPNYRLPSGNICSGPGSGSIGWIGGGCAPDYLNQGYNQQTGQSGQAADVPPSGPLNFTWLMITLLVLLLAVAL